MVKLNSQFSGLSVDPRVAKKAALVVADAAEDVEDARLMLDVLGLIPPQEGYLPYEHEDSRAERSRKRKKAFQELRRQQRETNKLKNRLKDNNVRPDEYGEGDEVEEKWEDVVKRMREYNARQ